MTGLLTAMKRDLEGPLSACRGSLEAAKLGPEVEDQRVEEVEAAGDDG